VRAGLLIRVAAASGAVTVAPMPAGGTRDTTRLISSKRLTKFADFPMPRHFPAYPDRRQCLDYLEAYADHLGLDPLIRTGQSLTRIEPAGPPGTQGRRLALHPPPAAGPARLVATSGSSPADCFTSAKPSLAFVLLATSGCCGLPLREPGPPSVRPDARR
jgi:hypothetical protein